MDRALSIQWNHSEALAIIGRHTIDGEHEKVMHSFLRQVQPLFPALALAAT